MVEKWIDQVGDWNPQLMRELKGRLTQRNLTIVLVVAVIGQLLILGWVYGQLPLQDSSMYTDTDYYCAGARVEDYYTMVYHCTIGPEGHYLIEWSRWWADVFRAFFGILTTLWFAGGVYLLVSDLNKENQRETLGFIRLSPRRSRNIFVGKLLGVPILLYATVGLCLPLMIYAGIKANLSLETLICSVGIVAAAWSVVGSLALLFGLFRGTPAWLSSALTLLVTALSLSMITVQNPYATRSEIFSIPQIAWFGLPLTDSGIVGLGFVLTVAGVFTFWIWHALHRRFYSPTTPLLSKWQGYAIGACFQILILGFFWQLLEHMPLSEWRVSESLVGLAFLNLVLFLLLIVSLTPTRQALLEWARFRHAQTPQSSPISSRSWIQSWLWADQSPALLALGIQVVLMVMLWFGWVVLAADRSAWLPSLASLLITGNLLMIYALIVQITQLFNVSRRGLWAVTLLTTALIVPFLSLVLLYETFEIEMIGSWERLPWIASAYGLSSTLIDQPSHLSGSLFGSTLLIQWTILASLLYVFTRRLAVLGRSEFQEIVTKG